MNQAISYSRFSTGNQQHGSSLGRQNQMVAEYCSKHHLTLIDSFHDTGKSGYHAKHLQKGGQLKLLLERIHDGTIPKGTHLLVEQTDRLTRQAVFEGLNIIQSLIASGLVLVTLDDGQRYDSKTDFGQLVLLLARLQRGHEESENKSKRLGHVWSKKAEEMNAGIVPKMRLPSWLERKDDEVVIIHKVQALINTIIDRMLEGGSCQGIAKGLNKEGIKTSTGKEWTASAVNQLMRNKSLIGLHTRAESKTVHNIYPPVISIERFNKVQAAIDTRSRSKGNSYKWNSALTGLAVCGTCGGRLKFSGVPKYRTGVCRASVDGGKACTDKQSITYKALVLGTVLALGSDLASRKAREKKAPNGEREALLQELNTMQSNIENLVQAIRLAPNVPELTAELVKDKEKEQVIITKLAVLTDPEDVEAIHRKWHQLISKELPELTTGVLDGDKEAATRMNIALHSLGDVEIRLTKGVASIAGTKIWYEKKNKTIYTDDIELRGMGVITNKENPIVMKTIELGTPENPRSIEVEYKEGGQPLGGGFRWEALEDYETKYNQCKSYADVKLLP